MSDLISRQDAISELYNINPSEDMLFVDAIVDMLENLPEKSEQRWIPVTEALPEDGERVLTTIEVGNKGKKVRSGTYFKSLFQCDNGNVWTITDKEVIAWMPLPEPWEDNNE